MKANVLTISMPTGKCNKCKYCVSKMTIGPDTNENDFNFNLDKAIAFALRANI